MRKRKGISGNGVGVVVGIIIGVVLVIVVILVAAGVFLLPALAKAQEAARRASCMNSCRQIGLAMTQYAEEHDGAYPNLVDENGKEVPAVGPDGKVSPLPARTAFAILLKREYLTTTKVFVCPSSNDRVTDDTFPSDYASARLQNLILPEKNCSYGWDPTKKHSADPTCALVADKPSDDVSPANEGTWNNNSDNHNKEGQNVFYNDGHIKWATTSAPDGGDDTDIYLGGPGYETSNTDAKIIR